MKGKKFIVIMAIFIILCSIQATTAFEDNNLTQVDIQLADVNTGGISEISVDDSSSNTSNVQTNVDSDNQVNADNDLKASNIASSSAASVNANSNLLGVGSDDLVGITAGTFIYGVDYDHMLQIMKDNTWHYIACANNGLKANCYSYGTDLETEKYRNDFVRECINYIEKIYY